GGLEYAKNLLTRSLSEEDAKRVIKQVTQQVQTTPFSFLQKAESENLLTFIQDEHPQTIALILAHLAPQKASEILVGLPSQKQMISARVAGGAGRRNNRDRPYMGPRRVSNVEAAQQKIVDIARGLEDAGEIIIAGRGGEKEMVV